MNNGMPNNMNGNGSYNNGGNSYAADRANAQMVSGQSSVGNGSGMMQGFSGVQNERNTMQGMANVPNNPGVMQGNNVPNQNVQPNQMPGQNHSGVNNYTMQKEEVKSGDSGVVSVPGFDSPSQSAPSVPNFNNIPNQNIGSGSNQYNNLGNSNANQNVNSTFNGMSNVNSNAVNNTPFSEMNSNNIYGNNKDNNTGVNDINKGINSQANSYGNSVDVNSNIYGGVNNTVSKPEVSVNEQKPLSSSLNNDSSLSNNISTSGNSNAFDRLNSAINDNYGSSNSKPVSSQVGNGIGSSASSVNSLGTSSSYGSNGVSSSVVNGTHDSDKKPDTVSIPKPAGMESLNNTSSSLNNGSLNSNIYGGVSNNSINNDNHASSVNSKPISTQVGNGVVGDSVSSSVNSLGNVGSYGTSSVNPSNVNGAYGSDKKPDTVSIPKPAGMESLNNTGSSLNNNSSNNNFNNNLNNSYNNTSNNVNSSVSTGIGSMNNGSSNVNNSGLNNINSDSGINSNSNNIGGVKSKRPEPMFRDNNQDMIGSTRDLNNAINGIKPTSMSDGVSQVGQMEMNNKPQVNTSYQPPKKKFPLSVREMILVSIALIGVVVVVIMYWPK